MKDAFTISKLRNIALAGILAAGVVTPAFAASQQAGAEEASSAQSQSAQSSDDSDSIISKLFGSNKADGEEDETPSKTETVYVFAKADGTVKSTIVSNWLKNADGDSSLSDVSNLTDIENTEGTQTFQQDGDKVTWDAQGSDIYYKGNSDKAAPVQIKVTYTLDGKTISPEDLAGKSGKVTIRYDYVNNSSTTQTVNGKERTYYTPFACVTGLLLDNEKFTNVTVENARTVNDGDHTIVAGFAFPGLQQDLDIADGDVDIPDHFEVTADVTDFKLGSTLTYVSSNLLNEIQTDDLDEDSIGSDIEKVEDAMGQLMSGSDELSSGLGQLSSGASQLQTGLDQLKSGTAALPGGVNQLSSATTQIDSGLYLMANGSSTQTGLKDALTSIGAGSTNMQTLYGGALALQNGASQITAGAQTLSAGTQSLIEGIGTSTDASTSTVNGALNIAYAKLGSTGDVQGALQSLQDARTTLTQLSADATKAGNDLQAIADALGAVDLTALQRGAQAAAASSTATVNDINNLGVSGVDDAKAAINNIDTSGLSDDQKTAVETQKAAALSALDGVSVSGKDQALTDANTTAAAAGQVSNGITAAGSSIATLQQSVQQDANNFKAAAQQLQTDAAALQSIDASKVGTAVDFATAQACIKGVQAQLNAAVGSPTDTSGTLYAAKNGADQIATGSTTISSGLETLKTGLTTLADGGTAPDGRSSAGISGAVDALGSASTPNTLLYGTGQMRSGLDSLAAQTPTLIGGIDQLASGAGQLSNGLNSAYTGSQTLASGLKQFNDEAVQKIVDMYHDDLQGLSDNLRATVQAGKDYQTFSGKSDSMKGSVKFVYETDSIGSDDSDSDSESDSGN